MDNVAYDLAAAIADERGTGRVLCTFFGTPMSVTDLAEASGLHPDTKNYQRCSEGEARSNAGRAISRNLSDGEDLIPKDRAKEIVKTFLDQFVGETKAFYTNGEFRFIGSYAFLGRWRQVTPERMSCGMLVLDERSSGVLWVADKIPSERAA